MKLALSGSSRNRATFGHLAEIFDRHQQG